MNSALKAVQARITVVGSLNQDIFLKVRRLPKVGETIAANAVERAYGGKGANAAVAAARLGATTCMLG